MSTPKALKRKFQLQQNVNKEVKIKATSSCPNLPSFSKLNKFSRLRRCKSEADIRTIPDSKIKQFVAAKSERNVYHLYHHSTPCSTSFSSPASPSSEQIRSPNIMDVSNYTTLSDEDSIKIPIIGYEVMEERSRFTIFKLRIENYEKNNFNNWLVLRRFTDFTRLFAKLRQLFPHVNLVLPKKKWFGNNFSAGFLDTRVAGLQTFINTILGCPEMRRCPVVREFFCLDEPPLYSESIEECKVIFEAQEETITHLKMQLKAKDEIIANLTQNLHIQRQQNDYLTSLVKSSIGKCSKTESPY